MIFLKLILMAFLKAFSKARHIIIYYFYPKSLPGLRMGFGGVNVTVSKLPNHHETKAVWEIQNLQSHLDILKNTAECNVKLGEAIKMKFFLKPWTQPAVKYSTPYIQERHYLSLNVQVQLKDKVNPNSRHGATIKIEFQYLPERKHSGERDGMCYFRGPKTIEVEDLSKRSTHLVIERFLFISEGSPVYGKKLIDENVRYGITLLLINLKTLEPQRPAKKPESKFNDADPLPTMQHLKVVESSHTRDFASMLEIPNAYSDLKLKLEDGTTFNVHKCVLAARSAVFCKRIENEEKNNTFDGTMKIMGARNQPFEIIVRWLYTGELKEKTEDLLQDVLSLALTLELPALVTHLDHKLPSICNTDNMFQLMHIAKKFQLQFSRNEIAGYIKKNMDVGIN